MACAERKQLKKLIKNGKITTEIDSIKCFSHYFSSKGGAAIGYLYLHFSAKKAL